MPRLTAIPRPPCPAGGCPPCPIDLSFDRYYVLDDAGTPVRVYDYTEHSLWFSCEGKAWQIKDRLPEFSIDVWTNFSGWASLKDNAAPVFRTTLSGCMTKTFNSLSWEEAEDKHARVIEKIRRTQPRAHQL